MMTLSNGNIFALLAFCVGNSPVTGEFPAQRPVTQSFNGFFICAWINGCVNNREAGDLRRRRAHYVIVMNTLYVMWKLILCFSCCFLFVCYFVFVRFVLFCLGLLCFCWVFVVVFLWVFLGIREETDCARTLVWDTGEFTSPDFPDVYPGFPDIWDTQCIAHIKGWPGSEIIITFLIFDVDEIDEGYRDCRLDYVEVTT